MSVTTNVPEQQLFFSGRRLDGGVREGVSQMSRNGNALPMAGEPIGRCGIVFRGCSHYSTVLRDLLVCVCVRVSAWQKDLAGLYAQWDCTAQETQVSECGESARSIYQRTQRGVVG